MKSKTVWNNRMLAVLFVIKRNNYFVFVVAVAFSDKLEFISLNFMLKFEREELKKRKLMNFIVCSKTAVNFMFIYKLSVFFFSFFQVCSYFTKIVQKIYIFINILAARSQSLHKSSLFIL